MPRTGRPSSWTADDFEMLRDLVPKMLVQDVADTLGKPVGTVRWYCTKFELPFTTLRPNWPEDDKARLPDLLVAHPVGEVAEILGRTEAGVRCMAHKRGLSVTSGNVPDSWYTQAEINFLYGACERMSIGEAAKELERSPAGVWQKAKKLGIRWHQGRRTKCSIAADMGIHESTLNRIAKRLGLRLFIPKGSNTGNVAEPVYDALMDYWFVGVFEGVGQCTATSTRRRRCKLVVFREHDGEKLCWRHYRLQKDQEQDEAA